MNIFNILSSIIIGIILGISIFFYDKLTKVKEVPLSYKIIYGAIFIPVSLGYIGGMLFQYVVVNGFTFLIYVLIAGQILLILISESYGDEMVRKLRYGRITLYLFGYALGIIGIFIPFFLILLLISGGTFHFDWTNLMLILVGITIFISSVWGFYNEEKYSLHDTKDEMMVTALAFANVVLCIFSFMATIFGALVLGDLVFRYSLYNMNHLAGVFFLPIGIYFLISSTRKLRRYSKQLNKKNKMVQLVN